MISYSQTVTELFNLQKYAIKLGLENITALSAKLGNPHKTYPTVHIAGTNGKGSTAFYTSKILQTAGLKVGLFTSPHLVDFRERIRVNDQLIEPDYVVDFWTKLRNLIHSLKATYFDTTTLLAFKYFADRKVDVAIIETGLGGRLDSTNVLSPEIAVLTPIGLDHQKQLGMTLNEIASEKAGIVKDNSDVIISRQESSVLKVFKSRTNRSNNVFYLPEYYKTNLLDLSLDGIRFEIEKITSGEKTVFKTPIPAEYQAVNISLALLVSNRYAEKNGLKLNLQAIKRQISKSVWPGRLQLIQKNPNVFFDVSHNLDGIKSTITSLYKVLNPSRTDLLLGIVNDKDDAAIVKFLSGKFRHIIVSEPETSRKQASEKLKIKFNHEGQSVELIKDLGAAYEQSLKGLRRQDSLIALGSHYLVGAIMKHQSS